MENSGLDQNITSYERHLWQVLAALGRAGYFVPPQDARDLIHDFYLEEWAGVLQRYNSDRSQFATYLAAAFYRFARRRILKVERWRRRTVDLEDVAELASAAAMPDQQLELNEEVALIRAEMSGLPAQEREVLFDFLASGDSNERALAQRHSLTRYRLREVLANAVGRLLAGLAADVVPATLDARIAKSLWVDGQTPRHVATLFGIDTAEVNARRLRFVAELMKSLRQFNHPIKSVRKAMNADIEILKTALFSDRDAGALARVRERADAILAAMGADDIELNGQQVGRLAAVPDWVAQVYAALGGADQPDDIADLDRALADMMRDEACEIGEAFSALAEALAESGYRWTGRFEELRGTNGSALARSHLMEDETVKYGGTHALELLEFGLTPAMIYGATRGLYLQFARLSRLLAAGAALSAQQANPAGAAFCVSSMPGKHAYLSHALALAGIAGTRDVPAQAVAPLLAWIKDVLPRFPFLIEGYVLDRSSIDSDIDLLVPVAQRPGDLVAQWSSPAPAILEFDPLSAIDARR